MECRPEGYEAVGGILLGTDSNGQDIFWQATFAVRNSLIISLIAGLVSRVIAILVGMVAGYRGGATDRILMFISDSLLVIPLFLIYCHVSHAGTRIYEPGGFGIDVVDSSAGHGMRA